MTFYGKLNVNVDDYATLRQMMVRKRVSDWVADQIIEELRRVEKPIQSLDDLFIKVPSLNMSIFEMIQDDVDLIGNININLASEEVLAILAQVTGIGEDQMDVIMAFREQETIESLDVLKKDLGEESLKKLAPYLDVTSKYFRITCTAQSASTGIKKEIIVEVARIPVEVVRGRVLEWRTQILSWIES
jgi:DNA uptake protein ComE-like DNA-binding protein